MSARIDPGRQWLLLRMARVYIHCQAAGQAVAQFTLKPSESNFDIQNALRILDDQYR